MNSQEVSQARLALCRHTLIPTKKEHHLRLQEMRTLMMSFHSSSSKSAFHINAKELLVALMFLQRFPTIQNTPILFRMDTQVAVQCIRRQMSSHSPLLMSITEELFILAAARQLHLNASYLLGRDNVWADALSRQQALDSSIRQYQSCWKTFQSFLQEEGIQEISQDVVLRFLCHLFHDKNRTLSAIRTHKAALKAPLFYGCNLTSDTRCWTGYTTASSYNDLHAVNLDNSGLSKLLYSLAPPQFPVSPPKDQLFRKALFLTALASGMRASQLHALSRHTAWVIESANPGKCPKGQDVRKMAASLLFLCSHSLDTTRQGGQWSSTSTFIRRYLATQVDGVPCVAMESMP
ncbi:hypothetical protein Pcinc_006844 [Petrolisthes cinctipes]|uniref:Uncharacterized protein n=1 Tax=Petrolisthes cinctipes TaxID=88211 RepID=A0AAE1KXI6_PETCI|nr:hypothetical protein Pcinc_006844 [Petrolisthes cinctipes]